MRAYLPVDPGDLGPAGRRWAATRDSAQGLADSLRRLDRRAPGYPAAYARFRRLYRRLTARSGERDEAYRAVTGEVRFLALWAAAAADTLRLWETRAYASYDSLAAAAAAASGREAQSATTNEHGHAEVELDPGSWWLVARLAHAENPFLEYVWEVPVVIRRGGVVRVPLFVHNVQVRWRH